MSVRNSLAAGATTNAAYPISLVNVAVVGGDVGADEIAVGLITAGLRLSRK